MGKTITDWQERVSHLVRDKSNKDLSAAQILETGIKPALGQYSIDRPRLEVKEVAGAGSAYFSLPSGWSSGFSHLEEVEFPARQNPPQLLDSQSWRLVRSVSDVSVEQILLDQKPATSQYVRFAFTVPWPVPDGTAATDKVDDVGFNAVTALAASFCLVHLAAESARARAGAMATDFADGTQRARLLMEAAKTYRAVYDSFLGIVRAAGDAGGSGAGMAPASRQMDFDPGRYSLFHGGRR